MPETETNQSPDTEAEQVIDVDELTNTITERVRAQMAGTGAGGDSATPDAAAGTASTEQATTPAASVPAPLADVNGAIEAGVRRVLGEQAHAEQHATMEVPRPARKGLARMIWGA